jgi:hypothetical protein
MGFAIFAGGRIRLARRAGGRIVNCAAQASARRLRLKDMPNAKPPPRPAKMKRGSTAILLIALFKLAQGHPAIECGDCRVSADAAAARPEYLKNSTQTGRTNSREEIQSGPDDIPTADVRHESNEGSEVPSANGSGDCPAFEHRGA